MWGHRQEPIRDREQEHDSQRQQRNSGPDANAAGVTLPRRVQPNATGLLWECSAGSSAETACSHLQKPFEFGRQSRGPAPRCRTTHDRGTAAAPPPGIYHDRQHCACHNRHRGYTAAATPLRRQAGMSKSRLHAQQQPSWPVPPNSTTCSRGRDRSWLTGFTVGTAIRSPVAAVVENGGQHRWERVRC